MSKSYRSAMDEIRMSDELKKKIIKASAKGEKRKGKLISPVYIGAASGIAACLALVFVLNHAYIVPEEQKAQVEMAQASEQPESNSFELADAGETEVDTADSTVGNTNNTADTQNKKTEQHATQATEKKAKKQDTSVTKEIATAKAQDTGNAKETSTAPETAAEPANTASAENAQPAETEPEEIVVAAARIMSKATDEGMTAAEAVEDGALPEYDNAAAMRASAPRSGGGGGSIAASASTTQPTEEPTEEAE